MIEVQTVPKIKIGWALMRVSTKEQAKVQHGSLEQQRHMLERWSLQQSETSASRYQITRFFEEDTSGRGKAIHKRMALVEIERAIETRAIDFVVFEKVDRLARDMIYNLGLLKKAQEHGVEVHEFESGKIDLRDRGSRLGFNIKNMLAEEYSLELEEKITKKQREARINNGKDTSTFPALGLDPHPSKRGMYLINKKEQEIVIDIFKKFIELGSIKGLSEYCHERGYKTKVRMTKEKADKEGNIIPPKKVGGDPLTSTHLRQLLINAKIRGYSFFKDTWNQFPKLRNNNGMVRWEYPHGPVIPLELFEEAEKILEKNAKFNCRLRGTVYYLSGILHFEDGTKFSGAGAHGRNQEYQYYHCPKQKFRLTKDEIEELIINRVKEYLTNSEVLKKMIAEANSMANMGTALIQEEVTNLRKRIKEGRQVIDGFSNYVRQAALTSPDKLETVIRTITEERDKAQTEVLLLERELTFKEGRLRELKDDRKDKEMREHLDGLLKNFDSQDDLKKREIIQLIIPRAIVYKDNKLELWVRRDLGGKQTNREANCGRESDFGHGAASYSAGTEHGTHMEINFLEKIEGGKEPEPSFSYRSGLSHLEESGSSESKMAGWTGLEPAAFRVTGGRYNQLNYHPGSLMLWERLIY